MHGRFEIFIGLLGDVFYIFFHEYKVTMGLYYNVHKPVVQLLGNSFSIERQNIEK